MAKGKSETCSPESNLNGIVQFDHWPSKYRLLNPKNLTDIQSFFSNYQHRVFQKWSDDIYKKGVNLVKAEQAGVETGSKMIAVRDRYRTDLVCRVENMSSCMPNIKGMVTSKF